MLSIPDQTAHVTKLADWLEFCAIGSPDGRVGFGTLVSASDLSSEDQPEDISEEDVWEDDLVLSVQNEINFRRKVIGSSYPFSIDEAGRHMQFAADIAPDSAIYLFCLFLSHAHDRSIVPADLAPDVDNTVRDLFQACSTVAAAGYVQGVAKSFGWPRPDGEQFLTSLKRIYALFGDGTPIDAPRPAAPPEVKDDGVDIIAWRPSPDGLAGTQYVLGQVASGNNWSTKSVVADAQAFHNYWFAPAPAAAHENAMFMPFCLEPRNRDDERDPQEVLVDHMQRLTAKYGTVIYRYRLAKHACDGLVLGQVADHGIERIDDMAQVVTWVQNYAATLKGAVAAAV